MKEITTSPKEKYDPKKHRVVLVTSRTEKNDLISAAVFVEHLGKFIGTPITKVTDPVKPLDENALSDMENAGFTLHSLNQEEFKDLSVLIVTALSELDFKNRLDKFIKSNNKNEIITINQE